MAINQAACDLALQVAAEGGALVSGGVSETSFYRRGATTRQELADVFKKQFQVFVNNKVDFLICEVMN